MQTPESVIAAIVGHSQRLEFGAPDPLIMTARKSKVGKTQPAKWYVQSDESISIAPLSADGKQTRPTTRYSVEEIASDALIGMTERHWHTLQVAIGIGDEVRPLVAARLRRIATRLQKRERLWPSRIRRKVCACGRSAAVDYIPDLVELTMLHLEEPRHFSHQVARARWFGLSESHWHAVARRPYDQVAAHLWAWYYAGIGHIQHRISRRGTAI